MPNQVTEGDTFMAGFSVMNRTDRVRTLEVDVTGPGAEQPMLSRRLELGPFKRETVFVEIQAARFQRGADNLVELQARAGDALDADRLVHSVPIRPRRSLHSAATHGSSDDDTLVTQPILIPERIHTDSGEISVTLSSSVLGNLAGAFEYMRDYPYACWEQKLSKAVMAAHYQLLRTHLPAALEWPGSDSLPPDTLALARRYQAPNGGMAYWVAEDTHVSPYLSAYTALAFEWLRDAGHEPPTAVVEKLHGYLQGMLRNETFPEFYSKGMASTVRAVALAALSRAGRLDRATIERYLPHVPSMSLFGRIQFLDAVRGVPGLEALTRDLVDQIAASGSSSAGKFQLNERLDSAYSQLLTSPLRSNCAALASFAELAQGDGLAPMLADLPLKMTRAIVQGRGDRDHFQNTQENLFCARGLARYAALYEAQAPRLAVSAALDGEALGSASFTSFTDPARTLTRPLGEDDPGRLRTLTLQRGPLSDDTESQTESQTESSRRAGQSDGQTPGEGKAADDAGPARGRFYYVTRLSYAPLDEAAERINAGIDIRREYSVQRDGEWRLLSSPMQVGRGELVRVDLYLSLPTARHFVVVDDPVPGGLEPVNQQLATASSIDAEQAVFTAAGGSWWYRHDDWQDFGMTFYSFYHKELRFDAARFYSDYLPPGNYHLGYTAQAIAPGSFAVQPAHSEEMYEPDVYGMSLPARLEVSP
ncbi:MAG: hypothetical protein KDK91_21435 [Gammaproteobacteria bacterium]|nr:hypothetical protein [Gammaproteobacteria bacterium]